MMLLRNFNAHTNDEQRTLFNTSKSIYREVIVEVGLKQRSQVMNEEVEYCRDFLALCSAHGFVIYTGLSQLPRLDALIFWNLN